MSSSCSFFGKSFFHTYFYAFLILCWIFGLFCGIWFAAANCDLFSSLMRSAVMQPVSIVGLLASVFLPLILTVISIVSCRPALCMLICLYKAVSYGFCGMLITSLFTTAGWLIRMLFLFSDCVTDMMLFWLWLRNFDHQNIFSGWDCYICMVVSLVAAGIDYIVVSPLLKGLF